MNINTAHTLFRWLFRLFPFLALVLVVLPGSVQAGSLVFDADITPATNPAGLLSITRVELVFDNGLATAAVGVNAKLDARANIKYSGNGPLVGQWLVDGQPVKSFNYTLTFGSSMAIDTAGLPALPTSQLGEHRVSLNFVSPAIGLAVPVISYTVQTAAGVSLINLMQPGNGVRLTRPRMDSLSIGASSTQPPEILFNWLPPVMSSKFNAVDTYEFSIYLAGDVTSPLLSSRVTMPGYILPPALAATLPVNRQLVWQVKALDTSGQTVAASDTRSVTFLPPSSIVLSNPLNGSEFSQQASWSASASFASYEARAYLNQEALLADIQPLLASKTSKNAPKSTATASVTTTSTSTKWTIDAKLRPGTILNWIVIGYDSQGQVQDISEIGNFYLPTALESLNGLPKSLSMAGMEISVNSYRGGTTVDQLAGNGTVTFNRDRNHTALAIDFDSLNVSPYIEQVQTSTGAGTTQTNVVHRVLKGRVMTGSVLASYGTAIVMDLQGYQVGVKSLSLSESGASAGIAMADLELTLPAYLGATSASSNQPVTIAMNQMLLEQGGDFYREYIATDLPVMVSQTQVGNGLAITHPGRLIADFSDLQNASTTAGAIVQVSGAVFLTDGAAELAAENLLPVIQRANIRLGFDRLDVLPDGLSGAFTVSDSDVIEPVVPGGYKVQLTGGAVTTRAGHIDANGLDLGGTALLPDGVSDGTGATPTLHFDHLKVSGGWLQSENAMLPELNWGQGATPFRILNASGSFSLPYGVIPTNTDLAGYTVTDARFDSPLQWDQAANMALAKLAAMDVTRAGLGAAAAAVLSGQTATPGQPASSSSTTTAATSKPAANTVTQTATTAAVPSLATSVVTTSPNAAAAAPWNLRIGVNGISGSVQLDNVPHTAKLGDFNSAVNTISIQFIDNAVVKSRLNGALVVPKPADFKLEFTDATVTSSGEIVGPKIVVPNELLLAYWKSKLIFPVKVADYQPINNKIMWQFAQADTGLTDYSAVMSDVPSTSMPIILAALAAPATSKTTAPAVTATPTVPAAAAATPQVVTPSTAATPTPAKGAVVPPTLPAPPPAATSASVPAKNTVLAPPSSAVISTLIPPAQNAITLSTSYLRINGVQLQFLIDAEYGPAEFDVMNLASIDIGADGQVQSTHLNDLSTRFLGMEFQADSDSALEFAKAEGDEAAPGTPVVTLGGNLTFPTLGARHVTLSQTTSGARADNITPNGGEYGNPEYIHYRASDIVYHNAYAEGTGSYKEFLGSAEISVLEALYLDGLAMVGADTQGIYEKVGLGIGVDAQKAASLYSSGAITVSAKVGAGVVNLATGGKSTAETEVAKLVGSVVDMASTGLAASATPKDRAKKVVKALADAITLAKRIHKDSGGHDYDDVDTSLSAAGIALNTAYAFIANSTDRSDRRMVLAIVDALDRILAIVVKSSPNGQPLSSDEKMGMEIVRLASKIVASTINDDRLTQEEWIGIIGQMLVVSEGFSPDAGYQSVIKALESLTTVAQQSISQSKKLDAAAVVRVAAQLTSLVRESGLIPSNDAQNALIIAQAILSGTGDAIAMPMPNSLITVAQRTLDATATMNMGNGEAIDDLKGYLHLASRSLGLVGVLTGGISYQQGAKTVQDALRDGTGDQTNEAYFAVDSLVTSWASIDARPLDVTVEELQNLLLCIGTKKGMVNCSTNTLNDSTITNGAIANVVQEILSAQKPEDMLDGMRRLVMLRTSLKQDFDQLMASGQQVAIMGKINQLNQASISQLTEPDPISSSPMQIKIRAGVTLDQVMHFFRMYADVIQSISKLFGVDVADQAYSTFNVLDIVYLYRNYRGCEMVNQLKGVHLTFDQASAIFQEYLGLEHQIQILGYGELDYGQPNCNVDSIMSDLMAEQYKQSLTDIYKVTNYTNYKAALTRSLGMAKQMELLGLGEVSSEANGVIADALSAMAVSFANPLSVARQQQLMGIEDPFVADAAMTSVSGGTFSVTPASNLANLLQNLKNDLSAKLQVTDVATLESKAMWAQNKLLTASRIQDAYDALDIRALIVLSGKGLTAKTQELDALLFQKGRFLLGDGIRQMNADLSPDELTEMVGYYDRLNEFSSDGGQFSTMVNKWISQSKVVSCFAWQTVHAKLTNPMVGAKFTSNGLAVAVKDLYARCTGDPLNTVTLAPDPNQVYAENRAKDFSDLGEFLDDLAKQGLAGHSEAQLKDQLAWKLAERIEKLTSYNVEPRDATQRLLLRVNKQTKFVLDNRQRSASERLIAGIQLVSEPLMEVPGIPPLLKDELGRISSALTDFAKIGGMQKGGTEAMVDLALILASSQFNQGSLEQSLLQMARIGVDETFKQVNGTAGSGITPTRLIGLFVEAARVASQIQAASGSGTTVPPALSQIAELLVMGDGLVDSLQTAKPYEQYQKVVAFMSQWSGKPGIGKFIKPLMGPEQSLLAPDTVQGDYASNLLLAELGLARNDNPINVPKSFMSTCPSFSPDKGIQINPGMDPEDIYVCAVDVARQLIDQNMAGAIDPLSPAGQIQNARQAVAGMQQETVFAKVSGNDQLSGISGMLELRNGVLSQFDFIATFGLMGQFETATRVAYDDPAKLLTIELATQNDTRDGGILSKLGLGGVGTNQLLGTSYFNNPIRYLLIQIGGQASCFDMTLDVDFTTAPLGTMGGAGITGNQKVLVCFDPFSFDLRTHARYTVAYVITADGQLRLFYLQGTGGIEAGLTLGAYPSIAGYGAFVEAAVKLALAGGVTGIEACGNAELSAGYFVPAKSAGACPSGSYFVPTNPDYPAIGGDCRTAGSIGAEIRAGTDYRDFFVKFQAGADIGVVYIGGWMYLQSQVADGGLLQKFPLDRYGGWSGVTSLSCGPLH